MDPMDSINSQFKNHCEPQKYSRLKFNAYSGQRKRITTLSGSAKVSEILWQKNPNASTRSDSPMMWLILVSWE